MERKTPRRAGCSPPYEPTPLGGCRWRGWNSTSCQADLHVRPCPGSRCADRSPLRLRLRGCGCGLGDGVVGGFCVERSHAACRHAQRCGAPKAPLKGGELAARNALSEGFCGRASGAWSNNALPTSLLLRKTSQSASLTAPLSGEPLAFAALRVTTSSVALVDAVGRRPRWSCVTAAVRKRKRSGKRFAHQQTGYGCSYKFAWYFVQCAAAVPTPYAGGGFQRWGERPPAFGGVFLPQFFLRYRRKNRAPGGR